MKHLVRLWSRCLLLLTALAAPVQAQTYDEWVRQAEEAVAADSLRQAEACLLRAVSLEPANAHNVWLYTNLGALQRRLMRYDEAARSYGFALNVAPYHVPALLGRASLYMETNRLELARIDYSLVLDIEKEHTEALLMRAYIYKVQRNYKFAKADYEQLLRLQPQHFAARLGLAMLYQAEGDFDRSLALLDALLADQPERGDLLCRARAEVELDRNRPEQALIDIDRSLQADDTQADSYLLRARILLAQDKTAQARRDIQKAVALGLPQAEAREWLDRCKNNKRR